MDRKEYLKQYQLDNKEKIKEYLKQYQLDNKEKIKEYKRLRYLKNKEKLDENQKQYNIDNKEKVNEYRNSPGGKKSRKISHWKANGLISDDYEKIYEIWLNCKNCEECGIELISGQFGSNKKCMDHSHITGEFRNVLCNKCNITRRG